MKTLRYLVPLLLLMASGGCGRRTVSTPPPAKPTQPTGPVRVLVLDDATLATTLEREWRARSEDVIEVNNDSTEALRERLSGGSRSLNADILIFSPSLLGELAERRIIRQLPTNLIEEPEYQQLDIFRLLHRGEILWNGRPYAVPLGSPSLVLLTRTDLVPDPPSTWAELQAEVQRLQTSLPADTVPLLQPLGEGWASKVLAARTAHYLYSKSRVSTWFDYLTLQPRLETPPFTRALEELVRDNERAPIDLTPDTVLRNFIAGKAAMAITWPSAALSDSESLPIDFDIRISELPGTLERYDFRGKQWKTDDTHEVQRVTVTGMSGRLGAITRAAKNVELATTLLGWATGPQTGALLCARSQATTAFRKSHQADMVPWIHASLPRKAATEYAEVVERTLNRSAAMRWLRLPDQHRYHQALEQAVHHVLSGDVEPTSALQTAASTWQAISEDLGNEAQAEAYRKSLGVTSR